MAHFVVVLLIFASNGNQNSTRTNENMCDGRSKSRQTTGNWSRTIGTQLGDINARAWENTLHWLTDSQRADLLNLVQGRTREYVRRTMALLEGSTSSDATSVKIKEERHCAQWATCNWHAKSVSIEKCSVYTAGKHFNSNANLNGAKSELLWYASLAGWASGRKERCQRYDYLLQQI